MEININQLKTELETCADNLAGGSIEDVKSAIEIKEQENKAEQDFMKSLEGIEKDKTSDIIERIYYIPRQLAKMVARGFSNGLLLYGRCGIGKSYSIIRAFKEEKVDFAYCNGFSTPLQLYTYLYEHREEHIILDDVSNVLTNPICLDILKSALYSQKGIRIVQYQTTSTRLKVPSKFEFSGTITILVNEIGNNEDLKAVADRILYHEIKLSYEETIKIIEELGKQKYRDLTKEERIRIVNWIKENTTLATENLNLRLLYRLYEVYRFDKKNWEKIAKELVIIDERVEEVRKLIESNISIKNACEEFIDRGLGSRATFFRIKLRLVSKVS